MDNLKYLRFSEINLSDPFFDSLRHDYEEFPAWFLRKADEKAYILFSEEDGGIQGFMYLKTESRADDVTPPVCGPALKIGTFKFNPKKTLRGHRFLKKALDVAIHRQVRYVYLTVFAKQEALIKLFETYGFVRWGEKHTANGVERVYVRDLQQHNTDPLADYPFVRPQDAGIYLLAIQPQYHTRLFPEAILQNEPLDIVKDVSHSNSIQKIYLSAAPNAPQLKKGDLLVMYRTGDGQGAAAYRSVASAVCTVLEVKSINSFNNEEEYLAYCERFSVFSKKELCSFYAQKRYPHIIRFVFNFAFPKRPIRKDLIGRAGLSDNDRWVLKPLTRSQFDCILKLGQANESFIVNQT